MLISRNADKQDANYNLSLCAQPGFGSGLNFYVDTLIYVCLQCFRAFFPNSNAFERVAMLSIIFFAFKEI